MKSLIFSLAKFRNYHPIIAACITVLLLLITILGVYEILANDYFNWFVIFPIVGVYIFFSAKADAMRARHTFE